MARINVIEHSEAGAEGAITIDLPARIGQDKYLKGVKT